MMHEATIQTWKEFLVNLLGTTVPFLIILAFIVISGSWGELIKPFGQGDFLLYATSFWVYSGYLIREKFSEKDGFSEIFDSISWFPILLSGVFYLVLFLYPKTSWVMGLFVSLFTFIPSAVFLFRNISKINKQKYREQINAKEVEQETINSMMEDLENVK